VLGLVAGLGLANNLTCVLLAPLGILAAIRGAREAPSGARAIAAAIGGLALGLVPYAYLPLAPDAASWAPIHSLGDLIDTVLRKDYGYLSHLPGGRAIPLATSLGAHAVLIGRTWLWIPAVAGVAILGLRTARGADRWGWAMLGASWLLAGPVFASRLGVDPAGVGGYIGGRMQIMSAVILAIPIALSFEEIAGRSTRELTPRVATGLAAIGFAALVVVALPRLQRVHGGAVEAGVRNMLGALPPAAIAVIVSEDHCFGARYLQLVAGVRPDVTIVCWTITTRAWYRERLARTGVAVMPVAGGVATVPQGEAWLATGRPLVVDSQQTALLAALPSYPVGILRRVLPRGARLPALGDVVEWQRAAFERFDLDYPRPEAGDDFAAAAHTRYVAAWVDLARALDAAGAHEQAAMAVELARQLAPE
jgi:hypothetical protein